MQGMMFAKETNGSGTGTVPAALGIGGMEAMVRSVAKLMACASLAFLAVSGTTVADPVGQYSRMGPVDAYLMERAQEIALARSAAPSSLSRDATVLVLTRAGYETAVTGTNGFVCWVGRGFGGAFDWPERLNPKIRAAECLNPPAARSVLPFAILRTGMFLAGRTTAETIDRIKIALNTREIPPLEAGAMSYMMSRSSYLTDEGDHNMPHVMFFGAVKDAGWGGNVPDIPVISANYWFITRSKEAEAANLPPLSVIITGVATWSDGTPLQAHRM